MYEQNDKLIKALTTNRYRIEIFEMPNSEYIIRYENPKNGNFQYSETIKDYNMASYLFELKADELEGN